MGLIMLSSGCVTTGSQYNSGQNGPVDCKDFPLSSNLKDWKKSGEKSCWIATTNDVQYVGTGYGRFFVSNNEYMISSLQVASGNTMFLHKDLQALLSTFGKVKNEAADWEDLPSIQANGRKYKLQRFDLNKLKHSCIGYVTYGSNLGHGYRGMLYGYSCKPQSQGSMQVQDIQRNLDSLQFEMW
jgi:hypothetical protein